MLKPLNAGAQAPWDGCGWAAVLLSVLLSTSQLAYAGVEGYDPSLSESGVEYRQPSALETSLELERRQQAIEQAQGELGVYDPALIEMYDDLGRFYQQQGQLEQARALYRQAFQLTRISDGLKSEQQIPYLDKVIESSVALNDWQQADDMQHLRYYLKSQLYRPSDPRFANAVAELGNWKLRAMRENLLAQGRSISREAEELSAIYRNSIARIQDSPEYRETVLVPLYQGKSHADLEIAKVYAETPYQFFEGSVSRFINRSVCTNVSDGRGDVTRQCTSMRVENPMYRASQRSQKRMLVNRSVRQVELSLQSLTDILARNPQIPNQERDRLTSEIRQLETEFQRIEHTSRRNLL